MQLCKDELHTLLNEQRLKCSLLLVFANKSDINSSLAANEVEEQLDLALLKNHDWKLFSSSAKNNTNIQEGFDWLVTGLIEKRMARF